MRMSAEKRLAVTFTITIAILVAEVAGGLISNSLALLSDAGHVFTDAFALGLSLLAARISRRPLDARATFGYHRVGLLAAVVNGVSLVGIAGFIFYESYGRFLSPPEIDLSVMLPVAAGGLLANLVMVFILGHRHEDLNVRSAWLHVLGDTLASVGVIVSGVVIYLTDWRYADPLAGALIGGIIVVGGARVVREALHVFLDLVPRGYDVEKIAGKIADVPEVEGVHDVHIRSLSHGRVSFSAHVLTKDMMLSDAEAVRTKIDELLRGMGVEHIMLQFESVECPTDSLYCRVCNLGLSGELEEHAHPRGGHPH
jgi:cobalt-zinc-cadmium efflux system protein